MFANAIIFMFGAVRVNLLIPANGYFYLLPSANLLSLLENISGLCQAKMSFKHRIFMPLP